MFLKISQELEDFGKEIEDGTRTVTLRTEINKVFTTMILTRRTGYECLYESIRRFLVFMSRRDFSLLLHELSLERWTRKPKY